MVLCRCSVFFSVLRRCRWRTQANFGRELEFLAVAHHLNHDLIGRLDPCNLVHGATTIACRFAVDAQDHIAQLQAGLLCRTVAENSGDDDARASRQAIGLRQFLGQWLHLNTQPATNHLAVFDD